jgi:hypothetical protein
MGTALGGAKDNGAPTENGPRENLESSRGPQAFREP